MSPPPPFIYICRTIPYIIPKHFLGKLQSILLKYIVVIKDLELLRRLYLESSAGGLGVPHLYFYNISAILDQICKPAWEKSAFFQYLQIRHVLNSVTWSPKVKVDSPFQKFLLKSKGFEKGISIIFKLLLQDGWNTKRSNMTRWKTELHKTFTFQEWLQSSQSTS